MRVKIFTEGGREIGLGHISRCSSLYDEIESRGIDVEFIIYGDQSFREVLGNRHYIFYKWTTKKNIVNVDINNCFCIVDSYKASKEIYYDIAKRCKRLLSIDDYNRIDYPKGIVVNPSIYTEEHNYSDENNIKYLLGKDFIILRQAFVKPILKNINKNIQEILIIMGGADIRSLTPKILSLLQSSYPNVKKNVVIGSKSKNMVYEINNTQFYYNLDAEEIKALMLQSDIAITAAGQTVYELIRVGTPFIPIQVIDNQLYTSKGLVKYKLVDKIIDWDVYDFKEELLEYMDKICKFENRLQLNEKYCKFIDGLGSKRIASELLRM